MCKFCFLSVVCFLWNCRRRTTQKSSRHRCRTFRHQMTTATPNRPHRPHPRPSSPRHHHHLQVTRPRTAFAASATRTKVTCSTATRTKTHRHVRPVRDRTHPQGAFPDERGPPSMPPMSKRAVSPVMAVPGTVSPHRSPLYVRRRPTETESAKSYFHWTLISCESVAQSSTPTAR